MNLEQFPYGDDGNLAYLLWSGNEAAAVDGGAPDEMLDFINSHGLSLRYVLNTHRHSDHAPGNKKLLESSSAVCLSPKEACDSDLILGKEPVDTAFTPGHSADSMVFLFTWEGSPAMLSGDTLFNCTVGNCYTRDYQRYFQSLDGLLHQPPETKVFAGHDLVSYATGVAGELDPGNPFLEEYLKHCSGRPLYTTIEMELRCNPFIRYNDPALDRLRMELAEKNKMPAETAYQRWRIMMTIH